MPKIPRESKVLKKFWPTLKNKIAPDKLWTLAVFFLFLRAAVSFADELNRVETDNFILTGNVDDAKLREWGDLAEERRSEIAHDLSFYYLPKWEEKCRVFVASSAKEFAEKSPAPAWAKGWSHVDFKKGVDSPIVAERKMWVRCDLPSAEMEPLFSHEIGHFLFREFLEYPRKFPLWLDEGVAVWCEARNRPGYVKTIEQAVRQGGSYPLKTFFGFRQYPQDKSLFYSQASSIIQYLLTQYGVESFQRFSRLVRDGVSVPEAMEKVYQVRSNDPEAFETQWKNWVLGKED